MNSLRHHRQEYHVTEQWKPCGSASSASERELLHEQHIGTTFYHPCLFADVLFRWLKNATVRDSQKKGLGLMFGENEIKPLIHDNPNFSCKRTE